MKIAIDIGHANGTGARGNGLEEHGVAKSIGHWLGCLLRVRGHVVDVVDFPDRSNAVDLGMTIEAGNAGGYDFGISVHCDASDNPEAHGGHVCFFPGSVAGARLAVCVADKLCGLLPGRAQAVMARPGLAVLRGTQCPWVLCECGFITNEGDAGVMGDCPDRIAQAIAAGVDEFVVGFSADS